MSSSVIEFLLLAAIALFVGWRLYVTLGEDSGPPEGRTRDPAPAAPESRREAHQPDADAGRPHFTGPAAAGLEAIYGADPGFNPRDFLFGARGAYEMIVSAFAKGDRDQLRPLLDDDVYDAWDVAITERDAKGEDGMQLLRLRKAEVAEASLDEAGTARVTVEFESELGDGDRTTRAHELWTFKRATQSDDPNWVLDDVDTAS